MLRDQRKSANYFEAYIAYQNDRIAKKKEKLAICGNDKSKAERIRLSLTKYEMDLLFAEFSSGYDKSAMLDTLNDAIDIAAEMNSLDYETLLNLLSISVILGNNQKAKTFIKIHKDQIFSDKLLKLLATYLDSGTVIWDGNFVIPKVYGKLADLDRSQDKESVLLEYLSTWYKDREDTSWYDSDKSDKDIYVGYWSFESAAIVKIMGIKDSKFKKNLYYPSL